ncbi:hypothetical protein [Streptomyces sp. NBC_00847]|uniref:hypothetical protein n=1 Tax=Streptomyces sp. NBC_00847 TaxID=2975850 RepID=UPI002B1E17AF|nr:hypothetical protein [Streptomyces sp. NBC_00847]
MQLFGRQGGVRLSEAGERFLPAALDALAAGDRAIAAVTDAGPVVRIDTWGHLYAPMRTVADAVQALGPVRWEPSPGRDWPSVAEALLRGDTDLGFGRVHPLPDGRDASLTQRLVRLEPVDAVVGGGAATATDVDVCPGLLTSRRADGNPMASNRVPRGPRISSKLPAEQCSWGRTPIGPLHPVCPRPP